MKNTGIVRRIDHLGRIVIPKELRRMRNISEGDPIEIYVDGDVICLRKYSEHRCVICGNDEKLTKVKGVRVCHACRCDIVASFSAE